MMKNHNQTMIGVIIMIVMIIVMTVMIIVMTVMRLHDEET